ncbi:MAG: HAD-IA family hydrolase [Pseudomonadota bacterium]
MNDTPNAVLFDLDGTLIDTAPDMVAVLQELQRDEGVEPVDYDTGRSYVSNGSLGLIRLGFGELEVGREKALQQDYLERYSKQVAGGSRVFPGLDSLLDTLDAVGRKWGVVTNKPGFLTEPLMNALNLAKRSAATVSGDTLPVRKPDPAPLLHACELAGLSPERTVYVGDAARDIEAGRRAGMLTIGVGYGYITADDDPRLWNADQLVDTTAELSQILTKVFKL